MKEMDITFHSVNRYGEKQNITATVYIPDKLSANTGLMMFCHGWGCNRSQHFDKMKYSCDEFDLVCVGPEYRMSGYAFDPVKGGGWSQPYDLSFLQTFDCINSLRKVLEIYPFLNRKKIFAYGGSQGGHIVLLSSIFAPSTFAFVYASCPLTHVPEEGETLYNFAERDFSEAEKSVRNVVEHASHIQCPVYLEAGTNDGSVPHALHAVKLEERLKELKKDHQAVYYEGGGHDLMPTTNKMDAYKKMIPHVLKNAANNKTDDFLAGNVVSIPCENKILKIDWSKGLSDKELFSWEKA